MWTFIHRISDCKPIIIRWIISLLFLITRMIIKILWYILMIKFIHATHFIGILLNILRDLLSWGVFVELIGCVSHDILIRHLRGRFIMRIPKWIRGLIKMWSPLIFTLMGIKTRIFSFILHLLIPIIALCRSVLTFPLIRN